MSRIVTIVLLAAAPAGCTAKLNESRSFALPEDGANCKILVLPAQPAEQTITIGLQSAEPVDLFVVPEKDAAGFEDLSNDQRAGKSLQASRGVKNESVAVKIPAKTGYRVVVALSDLGGKTDVKLTVKN